MSRSISAILGGKTYSGDYILRDGVLTVTSDIGIRETEIGGTPAPILARILLLEMALGWR